jgi:alkylation response protein AidB-like acyl-CoA dehydrogenase
MTVHAIHPDHEAERRDVLLALDDRLPALRRHARTDDQAARFPATAWAELAHAGLTTAVFPIDEGGVGLGTDRRSADTLFQVLTRVGGAHLSLARLFEGHVNAFALLWQYGSSVQRTRVMRYVRDGGILGVWNAPSPEGPLRLTTDGEQFRLAGTKIYASGAGTVRRPLLTATTERGELRMVWCDVTAAAVDLSGWRVTGMKATATGTIHLEGITVAQDEVFGADQDYHRQPAFSGGAWRFVAAQLGAAGALVDGMKASLIASGREQDPHQRARLADAAMLVETGRLWTQTAAQWAENPLASSGDIVSYVGMARLVVERASMDIIALAQRSVGLRGLMEEHPMERICRDLATYLRQPVPDAIRDGAATAVLASPGPLLDRWHP